MPSGRPAFSCGILASSFLSGLLHPSLSEAHSLDISLAKRELQQAEPGIENYLDDQGYTENMPDITDSVDFKGTFLPYLSLQFGYDSRAHFLPHDALSYLFSLNWTSSLLFGEQSDSDSLPIVYENTDFGDVATDWTYLLHFYGSLGTGVSYAPWIFQDGLFRFEANLVVLAGFSYLDARVDVGFDLSDNYVYKALGPEYVATRFGVAEETDASVMILGFGAFFHPLFQPTLSFGPFALHGDIGYRLESIPAQVIERLDGLENTKDVSKAQFNGSGKTFGLGVSYTFELK